MHVHVHVLMGLVPGSLILTVQHLGMGHGNEAELYAHKYTVMSAPTNSQYYS